MVDSTKSIGQSPGLKPVDKPQVNKPRDKEKAEKNEETKKRDEIIASKKALNADEAEKTARNARKSLEKSEKPLGNGSFFDENV